MKEKKMTTRKFTVLTVGLAALVIFILFWGIESCEKRETNNHRTYISSLPEGKTYVVRIGEVISLPDGTELRFIKFSDGKPSFLNGPYLYFPKGKLKIGEGLRYFGDIAIDLRSESFVMPNIKLPFTLHVLSADRNLIIYRISIGKEK